MGRPSFQFYPDAWRNDAGLRACSIAARGLWIDLLCLMHQGTPYGYLTLPGTDITPDIATIALQVGARPVEVKRLFDELSAKKVLESDEKNRFYSRKMVRDEEQRSAWRERQNRKRKTAKSFNNNKGDRDVTQLSREKERDVTPNVTGDVTPLSRRSSSSSPSSSPSTDKEDGAKAPESSLRDPPARPAALELVPEDPPEALVETNPNPYRFVAYWKDANKERDFGIRFEPENGPGDFIDAEIVRMAIEAPRSDIDRAVGASLEAFRATYSKRTGRKLRNGSKKTRGGSLSPAQLTEELVAWLRKDLARFAARPRAPARGGMKSVDEAINRSMERARQHDRRDQEGDPEWRPPKQ